MSKEMRKYIDTFKDRLLKENVSDAKFEEAFNRVKSYIDYCLSLDKPIRNLIPNSHIAETFKDTLKLLEIEHLYPNEFKKIANDQIKLFKSVSVLDIVLNDFSETNLTPSEIERVYLLRTDKHDFIRQNLKVIYTRMPDYVLNNLRNKTVKTNNIIIK
jgi:hypothetical protein